jgi:hypothetical protein
MRKSLRMSVVDAPAVTVWIYLYIYISIYLFIHCISSRLASRNIGACTALQQPPMPWVRRRSRSPARPASSGAELTRRSAAVLHGLRTVRPVLTRRSDAQLARTGAQCMSNDVVLRMQGSISSADANDYARWINDNPTARKTLSNLVGHIQVSMRHAFQSSAEQPAPKGIPFSVLVGWLLWKCHSRNQASIKDALHDLAVAEHRFFHVSQMAEKGDKLNELSEDAKIDLQMVHECLQLCIEESDRKKTIIKDIARESSEQPGRELLSLHVNSSEEPAWMQIPLASH